MGAKGIQELSSRQWDCVAMVVSSPGPVSSLSWSKNPGTFEVMSLTHLQMEDAASQGSHLLLYLEQGGVRAMVASLVREGNQTVKHQGG